MARYSIHLKASAAKEVEAIEPKKVRRQVVDKIRSLADDPRPRGCEKLSGQANRYRIRQGVYRIVFSVEDSELIVFVVIIGHRREVYR